MIKELAGKIGRGIIKWVVRILLLFLGLEILSGFFGTLHVEFAGLLLFGWITYLGRVLPKITFNPEIACDAAVALVLAIFGLHRILCWWARRDGEKLAHWRLGWTLKITVIALLLFVTSIAAVGIVQEVGALCREPKLIVELRLSRGQQTLELHNLKIVAIAVKTYADEHEGQFPKQLDDLVPGIMDSRTLFFTKGMEDDPPQQILYYSGYSARDAGATLILASPHSFESPRGRTRVVAHLDTTVQIIPELQFQELMQKQQKSGRQ